MAEDQFTITTTWLREHCTARGGYTNAQLQLLRLSNANLSSGWRERLHGTTISQSAARAFEQAKDDYSPKTRHFRERDARRDEKRAPATVERHERQLQGLQAVFAGAAAMALDRPLTSDDLVAVFTSAVRALEV